MRNQANTLTLDRAQLYTGPGALRSPKVMPEADLSKMVGIMLMIPRGTSFPLRRFAAIPLSHHIHQSDSSGGSPAVWFYLLKEGDVYAVPGF